MKTFMIHDYVEDKGQLIKWECGCPLIAIKEFQEGERIVVGGPYFPIKCPEHGAPLDKDILVKYPLIMLLSAGLE